MSAPAAALAAQDEFAALMVLHSHRPIIAQAQRGL
jgi:hypothetical protein